MANIINSVYNINLLDNLARKKTFIHNLHPLIKLITTIVYLIVIISFGRYEVISLLPFIFYPVVIFLLAELPIMPILKRVLLVEPLIIGIGILNPIFDDYTVMIGSVVISRGWVTFLSIFIKSSLTVTASILLIATTGMDQLASALRILRIPKVFVLQLLLTYRYISILLEEVYRMLRAYSLRAPGQKGIHRSAWGSFSGQLLLRTFDRAQSIYVAMNLRGFTGEYHTGENENISVRDLSYLFGWSILFIIARIINIPMVIGSLFLGVI